MTSREFTERDIHLALDGELPADERAGYERWLDAHPDMKARSGRYQADSDLLRGALAGVLDEPVPDRLAKIMTGEAPPVRNSAPPPWRMAAAAALIFAVGGLGGYFLGISGWRPVDATAAQLADGAIAAHAIYAAEKLHVVEVGADQKEHLVNWLSKRIGVTLVAPDLTANGFELIGGRLLPAAATKTAAQFMYQDRTGNRVSLYVARDASSTETGFRLLEEGDTRALYWLDDGYGCAIAGNLPEKDLLAIANSAYRQLLEGMEG
ncbi:MAG TPA: anti-sigma factor [Pseudaminobacter sp.]|nr:anti-sigma factor [Pseudaminobacter sp.]